MKRGLIALLALILGAVSTAVFAGTSYAGDFRNGTNVIVQKSETVDHTLFAAGSNVEIDGTVNGDVFCAGQNITINGTINGDVICAGMDVQINGTVHGNVRAAGQTVILSATVDHNASLAGNIVRTDANSKVINDLQAAGSTLAVNGPVGRDIDVAGSAVSIDGSIGRDAQIASTSLNLQSGASISGSLTYYSDNTLTEDSGAQVAGTITKKQPAERHPARQSNPVVDAIMSFLLLLTLGLVLIALLPRRMKTLTDLALTKPLLTLAIGLAACIGVPVIIVVSFLTVVGAFVGIVLLLSWIVVMIVSAAVASYYTGRLILYRMPQHPFVIMLTGVFAVSVLLLIPFVNILAYIAIVLFGSGMIVRSIFMETPKPQYTSLTAPKK